MFLKTVLNFFSEISLRTKITMIFVIIFGTTTLLFNLSVFYFMTKALEDDFDIALYNYSIDVAKSIDLNLKDGTSLPVLNVDQGKILPFPLGNAMVLVRDAEGVVLSQVGELNGFVPPFKKDLENLKRGDEASYRTVNYSSEEADSYRLITFSLDETKNYLLQIAAPLTLLERQINRRLDLLKYGMIIVLLVATASGIYITGRAFGPINSMVTAAQSIDAQVLSARVPVPTPQDEVRKLALTLNEMLERIERAFQSQERFVADASHQLKTPLSILQGELEQIQKNPDDPNNPKLISSCLQEVDNLSQIFNDMLLLARVDAGMGAIHFQSLSLDELLLEVIQRIEKAARKKDIKILFNIKDQWGRKNNRGDWDLLAGLFFNIIENGIKYSKPNTSVDIELEWGADSTRVSVRDHGDGIPKGFESHLFERFSRAYETSHVKGFGLGLAIAYKIAQVHNAQLTAKNHESGGALFQFEIKNI